MQVDTSAEFCTLHRLESAPGSCARRDESFGQFPACTPPESTVSVRRVWEKNRIRSCRCRAVRLWGYGADAKELGASAERATSRIHVRSQV
jgi:hypothetical protein